MDDLVLTNETMDGLLAKLKMWKKDTESKGLRVNLGKTKKTNDEGEVSMFSL